jgi:hypothetical protein
MARLRLSFDLFNNADSTAVSSIGMPNLLFCSTAFFDSLSLRNSVALGLSLVTICARKLQEQLR